MALLPQSFTLVAAPNTNLKQYQMATTNGVLTFNMIAEGHNASATIPGHEMNSHVVAMLDRDDVRMTRALHAFPAMNEFHQIEPSPLLSTERIRGVLVHVRRSTEVQLPAYRPIMRTHF